MMRRLLSCSAVRLPLRAAIATPVRAAVACRLLSSASGGAAAPNPSRLANPIWKKVSGSGAGRGVSVVSTFGNQTVTTDEPTNQGGTDRAATPLQTLLGALMGCEHATIVWLAKKMGVTIDSIKYDLTADYDARGILGVEGVPARFQTVRGTAVVVTTATQEQLDTLVHQVHARCPIANLFVAGGVKMEVKWTKAA